MVGSNESVLHRGDSVALDGLDLYLVKLLDKELAVFGRHNGLDGRTEYIDAVTLQDARLKELDTTVERGLPTEG